MFLAIIGAGVAAVVISLGVTSALKIIRAKVGTDNQGDKS
jgi:hypothetical protein